MKTIKDIEIGNKINSPINGEGMVTGKTKRTVTVTFTNGNTVKITYRHSNAYFYETDF